MARQCAANCPAESQRAEFRVTGQPNILFDELSDLAANI